MSEDLSEKEEYTCSECGETYKKGWSDEEVIKEKNENFPTVNIDDCVIVCDDCYKEIIRQVN